MPTFSSKSLASRRDCRKKKRIIPLRKIASDAQSHNVRKDIANTIAWLLQTSLCKIPFSLPKIQFPRQNTYKMSDVPVASYAALSTPFIKTDNFPTNFSFFIKEKYTVFSPAFKSIKNPLLNYFSMPWLFFKISIFHNSYFNSLTFPWSWRIMFPRPFPDVRNFRVAVCFLFRPSPPAKAFTSKSLISMRVSEMKHIFISILRVARRLVLIPRQSQLGKGLLTYALFRVIMS